MFIKNIFFALIYIAEKTKADCYGAVFDNTLLMQVMKTPAWFSFRRLENVRHLTQFGKTTDLTSSIESMTYECAKVKCKITNSSFFILLVRFHFLRE